MSEKAPGSGSSREAIGFDNDTVAAIAEGLTDQSRQDGSFGGSQTKRTAAFYEKATSVPYVASRRGDNKSLGRVMHSNADPSTEGSALPITEETEDVDLFAGQGEPEDTASSIEAPDGEWPVWDQPPCDPGVEAATAILTGEDGQFMHPPATTKTVPIKVSPQMAERKLAEGLNDVWDHMEADEATRAQRQEDAKYQVDQVRGDLVAIYKKETEAPKVGEDPIAKARKARRARGEQGVMHEPANVVAASEDDMQYQSETVIASLDEERAAIEKAFSERPEPRSKWAGRVRRVADFKTGRAEKRASKHQSKSEADFSKSQTHRIKGDKAASKRDKLVAYRRRHKVLGRLSFATRRSHKQRNKANEHYRRTNELIGSSGYHEQERAIAERQLLDRKKRLAEGGTRSQKIEQAIDWGHDNVSQPAKAKTKATAKRSIRGAGRRVGQQIARREQAKQAQLEAQRQAEAEQQRRENFNFYASLGKRRSGDPLPASRRYEDQVQAGDGGVTMEDIANQWAEVSTETGETGYKTVDIVSDSVLAGTEAHAEKIPPESRQTAKVSPIKRESDTGSSEAGEIAA